MDLPIQLLASLEGINGFDKDAFLQVHSSGSQVTSIRYNPAKVLGVPAIASLQPSGQVPWTPFGYYLSSRPSFTFDPFFHAGCYYVQEASSMFLEYALKSITEPGSPLKVLDLSAAPGGKSTHIQSLISADSLLISNEVIRSRAAILRDNIVKWGCANVIVTNSDPRDIGRLEGFFDIIIVDAPCSGSGLFRREPEAMEEWSLNNVGLCSQRQQRILADVWPSLKDGGFLVYSTCSYSREEDENIMDWVSSELGARNVAPEVPPSWGIVETSSEKGNRGYRFWPYRLAGEGFFLACFQKAGGAIDYVPSRSKTMRATKNDVSLVKQWLAGDAWEFVKHDNTVYAWPAGLSVAMNTILCNLKVLYSGIRVGELMRDKLVPDHALAMNAAESTRAVRIELSYEDAIRYLQRREILANGGGKGWKLACYHGFALGWINVLPNRINNYYPKELRILKDSN